MTAEEEGMCPLTCLLQQRAGINALGACKEHFAIMMPVPQQYGTTFSEPKEGTALPTETTSVRKALDPHRLFMSTVHEVNHSSECNS